MGYALRHLSDLNAVFREFFRVLKPEGKLCVLELIQPKGKLSGILLKWYMRRILPPLSRLITRRNHSELLWKYYWDTIESCLPPKRVLKALDDVGFGDVTQHTELGIFTEYNSARPHIPTPINPQMIPGSRFAN
jgi:demethylmenaquinone methyltransferase/2-methoxy-6-polyprenyl-1,4-benzoquinol methylase